MAVTLSITVTDAQALRARTALGHWDNSVLPAVWAPATAAEVRALILQWLKARVIDYETTQENEVSREAKAAEAW